MRDKFTIMRDCRNYKKVSQLGDLKATITRNKFTITRYKVKITSNKVAIVRQKEMCEILSQIMKHKDAILRTTVAIVRQSHFVKYKITSGSQSHN